jgi:nicotinamide phosphoribosyltransferase
MDNWGYGMGGALLQQQNRDTMRFAIKCSAIRRDGTWEEVHKTTITDPSKASIGGRFNLMLTPDGEFETSQVDDFDDRTSIGCTNLLETVFEDGKVTRHQTLEQIRAIAKEYDRYDKEEY